MARKSSFCKRWCVHVNRLEYAGLAIQAKTGGWGTIHVISGFRFAGMTTISDFVGPPNLYLFVPLPIAVRGATRSGLGPFALAVPA